jgi:hypothetical protein
MPDASTMTACATTTPAINAIHTTTTVRFARKLAVLLRRLWITGSECDPLRHAEGRNQSRRQRA